MWHFSGGTEKLAFIGVILIALAITLFIFGDLLKELTADPQLHSYTVVRFNPAQDILIRPTVGPEGLNNSLIITSVIAHDYEHERDDCYLFYFDDGKDTICGIIHVSDKGTLRQGGAQ